MSMFAADVSLDLTQLAMDVLLSDNEDSMAVLDTSLSVSDVLKVFKFASDNLSNKVSGRINRKLKRYIKTTNRPEADKKLLNAVYEAYKTN